MVAFGGALVLGSCQQVADDAPVEGQSAPAETVARSADAPAQDYPPLQSVPPRPRLSYTVQQQREIVGALVADRENARYTSQVIRYRSGLSSMPPPPAPPEKLAVEMPQPGQETGASGAGEAPASKPAGLTEQETLVDFLAMLRRTIFADEPEEPKEAPRPAPPAAEATTTPTNPAQAVAAAGTGGAPPQVQLAEPTTSETQRIPPPMPPARSAVAARMASRPQPIDDLLDQSVAQAPLPPLQPGSPDRQDIAQPPVTEAALPPLPAPPPPATRPVQVALPSARPPVLAPPPIKPVVPILAPSDPKPAHDQSVQLLPWRRPTAERFG